MINLGYLAQQTAGDVDLQQELLTLLHDQLREFDARLAEIVSAGAGAISHDFPLVLHRLRGAAVAVGAERLATVLRDAETAANAGSVSPDSLMRLRIEVSSDRAELSRLIATRACGGLAKVGESR